MVTLLFVVVAGTGTLLEAAPLSQGVLRIQTATFPYTVGREVPIYITLVLVRSATLVEAASWSQKVLRIHRETETFRCSAVVVGDVPGMETLVFVVVAGGTETVLEAAHRVQTVLEMEVGSAETVLGAALGTPAALRTAFETETETAVWPAAGGDSTSTPCIVRIVLMPPYLGIQPRVVVGTEAALGAAPLAGSRDYYHSCSVFLPQKNDG
ncbi:hypothetical protein V8F20_002334 [Naviculisporaceae sp. PSN 640]